MRSKKENCHCSYFTKVVNEHVHISMGNIHNLISRGFFLSKKCIQSNFKFQWEKSQRLSLMELHV